MPQESIFNTGGKGMRRRSLGSIMIMMMALSMFIIGKPVDVHAVAKNITVMDGGKPLANATVTIQFPDGSKQEKKTDKDGLLVIEDAPPGTYKIFDGTGKELMTFGVTSGVAGAVIVGLVGVTAIGVANGSQGSDSGVSGGGGGGVTNDFANNTSPLGYSTSAGSCGIGTTNLSTSGSTVTLSPFGTNGPVDFTNSPGSNTAQSVSNNLTIFGGPWHICSLLWLTNDSFQVACEEWLSGWPAGVMTASCTEILAR